MPLFYTLTTKQFTHVPHPLCSNHPHHIDIQTHTQRNAHTPRHTYTLLNPNMLIAFFPKKMGAPTLAKLPWQPFQTHQKRGDPGSKSHMCRYTSKMCLSNGIGRACVCTRPLICRMPSLPRTGADATSQKSAGGGFSFHQTWRWIEPSSIFYMSAVADKSDITNTWNWHAFMINKCLNYLCILNLTYVCMKVFFSFFFMTVMFWIS